MGRGIDGYVNGWMDGWKLADLSERPRAEAALFAFMMGQSASTQKP